MRVQLQRLLQLLLVGELFFSKPQRSEIVFSTRSRYFSTMGNLHSIWAVQCSVLCQSRRGVGGQMLARVICLPY